MDRVYLIVSLVVCYMTTVYCRSPVDGIHCSDAANKCRAKRECHMALRSLDEKCKVMYGRCGAEMKDLPRCGEIMDQIFSLGFPAEPCKCNQKSKKCFSLYSKIYSHPCFASIRHLRKHNLFPEKIAPTGSNIFTTAVAVSLTARGKSEMKPPIVSIGISTTASTPLVKNKVHGGGKSSITVVKDDTKTDKSSVTKATKKIDPESGSQSRGSSMEDEKNNQETQQLEDKTDYKLISIILGTILVIFVITAVVFFAWIRVRKTLFYKNGKVQVSNRGKLDGAASSRSESGMPPRSKA